LLPEEIHGHPGPLRALTAECDSELAALVCGALYELRATGELLAQIVGPLLPRAADGDNAARQVSTTAAGGVCDIATRRGVVVPLERANPAHHRRAQRHWRLRRNRQQPTLSGVLGRHHTLRTLSE